MHTPRRTFVGQHPVGAVREGGLGALAEVFLGSAGPPAAARAARPRSFYALLPAGIEPPERRRVGLAVARRLVPACRAAAVFVFDHGRADAHLVGEPACGRVGPLNYLHASDFARVVPDLLRLADQVGIVCVDPPNGRLADLDRAVGRAVFVAAPDPESLVETYRGLKSWRAQGAAVPVSLFVVGSAGAAEADRVRRRLAGAAREFLGCDVASEGYMNGEPAAGRPEPLSVLVQAPAGDVWRLLLESAREAPRVAVDPPPVVSAARGPEAVPVPAARAAEAAPVAAEPPPPAAEREPTPAECPAFSFWEPADRGALVAAVEAQVPALVDGRLRLVLRVDVDEPDAPPLAAVRDDGALVAIVLGDAGGLVDTRAAARWLEVHRSLLVRAYPSAGITERTPSVIVLAPWAAPVGGGGVRRFITVRTGGRHGIVLLP